MAKEPKEVLEADFVVVGKSPRDRVAQWITIRQQEPDLTTADIARKMNLTPRTLYAYLQRAHKEGWLRFDDPLARVEHEIIPKVLDNMSLFLDQRDKQTTIEAFKSTVARSYQEARGLTDAPQTFVAIKIEAANPDSTKIITGQIVGKPRE